MKCDVCYTEFPDGKAECPNCGCPVVVSLGSNPQEEEHRKELAEQYRQQICRDIEVGFVAYSHKVVTQEDGSEKLEFDHDDLVPLGTCGSLLEGQTSWYPEGFVRPRSVNLDGTIYVRRGSLPARTQDKRLTVPCGEKDLFIGLKKVSTAVVKICLKDGENQTESDEIFVL